MSNICFVSYYELKEALLEAANSLKKIGYKIFDFPMFKYVHDINDKRSDYSDYFISYLIENKINIVLWWFIDIDTDKFKIIKDKTSIECPNIKYILFNWDDPFNWDNCDLAGKASYFDYVFITCKETLEKYKSFGSKNTYYLLPGFSPKIHDTIKYFDLTNYHKYSCDISFCCTNLYADPIYDKQYISRKRLIDDIYDNQNKYDYKFNLYGPDFLQKIYPDSYKSFITYDQSSKIFYYSKINLCTHVISNMDGYVNERVILIGGSGGLLLVDNIKGINKIFDTDKEIIIIDKNNYIEQIKNILDNYDQYINHRQNLYKKCHEQFTYDHWASFIHEQIKK